MEPVEIIDFELLFAYRLPETMRILKNAHLRVHPAVTRVTLHGSRGLAGSYRPDSDIDLSLLVDAPSPPEIGDELGHLMQAVIETTLSAWHSPVQLDLAAVFALHDCQLACFERSMFDPALCSLGGRDCFGLYKTQKGFKGFVLNAGIQVERMYPCITVWRKGKETREKGKRQVD